MPLRKKLLQTFASVEALEDLASVAALACLSEVARDHLDAVNTSFLNKQRQQLCRVMPTMGVISLSKLFLE